jgi:hypothetical protein
MPFQFHPAPSVRQSSLSTTMKICKRKNETTEAFHNQPRPGNATKYAFESPSLLLQPRFEKARLIAPGFNLGFPCHNRRALARFHSAEGPSKSAGRSA